VRKDIIAIEKAIAERLGYLQRYKVVLTTHISAAVVCYFVYHIVCTWMIALWFVGLHKADDWLNCWSQVHKRP